MNGENKIIIGTIILAVIGIIGIFVVMFSLAPKQLTEEEIAEILYAEDNYVQGNESSEIVLTTFEDFQCPACASFQVVLEDLKSEYGDSVKFIFRHFPLYSIHPNAQLSSEAAEVAGQEGKFYEYHDLLFAKQLEWESLTGDELISKFVEYAEEVGVEDLDKFEGDLRSGKFTNKVNRDAQAGTDLGVSGTPTIFINTEKVSSLSYPVIQNKIEGLLNQ